MCSVFIFRLSPGCVLGPVFNRPPLLIGLLCLCLVRRLWSCSVACVSWPLEGVLCVSLHCSVRFSCVVWSCFGWLISSWQRPPRPARPSVGPLGLSGPVSFCWSLPPGIWLYLATARLSCLVVWSVVTARLLSSLFLKGFGPVWSSALYTMLRVLSVLLSEALVEEPDRLISEITAILETKQVHPLLEQI